MTCRLVIFGASGDLTSRKLIPALVELHQHNQLPCDITVLGIARQKWDTEAFRQHIGDKLEQHTPHASPSLRDAVLSRLEYRQADVTNAGQVKRAFEGQNGPLVIYLALPPHFFAPAIKALDGVVPEGSRIVIEKPFGEDLAQAQALNQLLSQMFPERSVYRLDHFLHKQTIQNILGLRFANRVFEHLWNRDQIERIEIVWDEKLSLEGRVGYYDLTGALKDMIQNHLLQLLCLIGMDAPLTMNDRDLRDRKVDVLRAVRRLSPDEVRRLTVRGRYTAGRIGDHDVPAYTQEKGIDLDRQTETFAQVTLYIDNWRWAGVPFLLRTGKALAQERREIAVYFRPVPHLAFVAREPLPNVLRVQLSPDRLALRVNINRLGDLFHLDPLDLDADLASEEVPAYGRVLRSVFEGDCTLSIRADEALEAWRIVEPILAGWARDKPPLLEYPAGSAGLA